jgi:hypothetical protein
LTIPTDWTRRTIIDGFEEIFRVCRVVRYPDVGHFVPDDPGPEVADEQARAEDAGSGERTIHR